MEKRRRLSNILWFFIGNISFWFLDNIIHSSRNGDEKNQKYCQLFDNWLIISERGSKIEEYFRVRGINKIAVYGYGNIGRHLVTQLLETEIAIKGIIDRASGVMEHGIDRYYPTDTLPEVDAVIVTPICEYQEIKSMLRKQISCQIISIENIIFDLL